MAQYPALQTLSPRPQATVPAGEHAVSGPKKINWGGVIKGALIVTAAVAACVVVGALVSSGVGAVLANPTASAIAGSAVSGVGSVIGWISSAVIPWVGGFLGAIFAPIGSALGIGSTATALSTGAAATSASWTGWIVGGLAGAKVVTAAMPTLTDIKFTVPDTATPTAQDNAAIQGAQAATQKLIQTASDHAVKHHDARYGQPQQSWTDRAATSSPYAEIYGKTGSYAAAVNNNKTPAASFTEQMKVDAAKIEASLAESHR